MNRDEILRMSREENEGRHDEREEIAHGAASNVGMFTGAIICVALMLAGDLYFHIPQIGWAGSLVYFAMLGSSNVVLYRDLKIRKYLVWGIVEIIAAVVFAAVLVSRSAV